MSNPSNIDQSEHGAQIDQGAQRARSDQISQISERVERLLLRHAEVQRTNALLSQQLESVTQERDSLKSRLAAARARVDALLDRLPETAGLAQKEQP